MILRHFVWKCKNEQLKNKDLFKLFLEPHRHIVFAAYQEERKYADFKNSIDILSSMKFFVPLTRSCLCIYLKLSVYSLESMFLCGKILKVLCSYGRNLMAFNRQVF